ncbi:hypothetical protein [Lysinibacillus xylanilyticus]|uniref:hypothetical protein n=1 Tax=Lysinibacillus xylanilyticus TaxID=582475 RepID=UPI0036DDC701
MEKKHHIEMIQEGQMNIFEADYQAKEQGALKMVEQAMAKLQAELRVERVHPYVAAIGNYLMDLLKDNPSSAEKIMAEGKTIIGSMKAMRKVAEKLQVDNCAVLTPEQGFKVVLDYFGIKDHSSNTVLPSGIQADVPKTTKPTTLSSGVAPRFEASLDEFL